MKIILNLIILILINHLSFTQNIVPNDKIIEAFGQEKTDQLIQNNPDLVDYYNFYLDNAFFFSKPTGKSVSNYIDIYEIKYVNDSSKYFDEDVTKLCKDNFNPLKYQITPDFHRYTHFKLGETGRYIVFKPTKIFIKEYKYYKKNK